MESRRRSARPSSRRCCRLDPSPLPLGFREEDELWHYAGDYHNRQRQNGTDVDVCFRGNIAVTRLSLV